MRTRIGFVHDPQAPPARPDEVRPLTFDDVWAGGAARAAPFVVPVQCVQAGDTQVGVFTTRAQLIGTEPPLRLDELARFESVTSIVGGGPAVLRTPLTSVEELVVSRTDNETLANLPSLRRVAVTLAIDRRPLDPALLPAGLEQLSCSATTFGGVGPLARFTSLWRLGTTGLDKDVKPLGELSALRSLRLVGGKGLRHLGRLEQLEELVLTETGSLAGLRAFGGLKALRLLEIGGRGLRSLDGVQALESLTTLTLKRTAVADLEPAAEVAALRLLDIDERFDEQQVRRFREQRPDVEVRWEAPESELTPFEAVGAIRYRQVSADRWAILQDVTALLDVDDNIDAQRRIVGAVRGQGGPLGDRLTFDSDAEAVAIYAATEPDIRAVAGVVEGLRTAGAGVEEPGTGQ